MLGEVAMLLRHRHLSSGSPGWHLPRLAAIAVAASVAAAIRDVGQSKRVRAKMRRSGHIGAKSPDWLVPIGCEHGRAVYFNTC